jgi:hypothetical protein
MRRAILVTGLFLIASPSALADCHYKVFIGEQWLVQPNPRKWEARYDISSKTFTVVNPNGGIVVKQGMLETLCKGKFIVLMEHNSTDGADGVCTMRITSGIARGSCRRAGQGQVNMVGKLH